MSKRQFQLLVGDNAFHGISHLSQQRARERSRNDSPSNIENAARLVNLSLQNGANGFMFSVSETTLAILKTLDQDAKPDLYAIVPYAYEYVRRSTKAGGISGLVKQCSKQIVFSRNVFAAAPNFIGILNANPSAFLRTYLIYELSRIKSVAGHNANIKCVSLHEVITDMALALNLDWLFRAYVKFFSKSTIQAGFETRNFPYLVQKFKDWHIDLEKISITTSFNKVGFQMNPSQVDCENTLSSLSGANVIAMSVLAAGYLKLDDAIDYIKTKNLGGIVVGVSKEQQARETFELLRQQLC